MSTGVDEAQGMGAIHALLTRMLVALDAVATSEGLRYFLAYGTALGAVRESAPIPWDPDADVLVPVDDYDALCEALAEKLPDDIEILRPERLNDYEYPFARLALKGVDHKFIRVDLFPLSSGPTSVPAKKAFIRLAKTVCLLFMLKRVSIREKIHYGFGKRAVARAAKLALLPVPTVALFGLLRLLRRGTRGGRTLVNPCGSYGLREFFDPQWFSTFATTEFRGESLRIPGGCDAYLRHVYGEYMTPIPPERQREELQFAAKYYVGPLRDAGVIPGD